MEEIRKLCKEYDVDVEQNDRKKDPIRNCIEDIMKSENSNVRVAIIDSGINPRIYNSQNSKTVIANNLVSPCNGEAIIGYNFTDEGEDYNILDTLGHGTAVALALDKSLRFYNHGDTIGIVPLKVISSEIDEHGNVKAFAKMSDMVCALYFAAAIGVEYINISIGILGHMIEMPLIKEVLNEIQHKGIVITTSAGNESTVLGKQNIHVPSHYAAQIDNVYEATGLDVEIFSVSTKTEIQNAHYILESNYYTSSPDNNRMGVAAPAVFNTGTDTIKGTSFAAPWLLGALISGKKTIGTFKRSRINIDDVIGNDIE